MILDGYDENDVYYKTHERNWLGIDLHFYSIAYTVSYKT